MNIFVYSSGTAFYKKMASIACISHKRCNSTDDVFLLSSDDHIEQYYTSRLEAEGVLTYMFPETKKEMKDVYSDGDMMRFHTFARWLCYIKWISNSNENDVIDAVLDPDIISLESWTGIEKKISDGVICFTRQFDWDGFINGGFILGHRKDMKRVGEFLLNQLRKDISEGAHIKLPYDQIYWNRYYCGMNIEELCVGNDFLKLAFDKKIYSAKLVHQIDFKGTLFKYDTISKIINECNFDITEDDYAKY